MAQGDLRLAGAVGPLWDVLGRAVVKFEHAIGQQQRQGQAGHRGFAERRRPVFLSRGVAVGVPFVDDLVVADDEERLRLSLRQLFLERVEFLGGNGLALRGRLLPFKWLSPRRTAGANKSKDRRNRRRK